MLNNQSSKSKEKSSEKIRVDEIIAVHLQELLATTDMETICKLINKIDKRCQDEQIKLIHHTDNSAYQQFMNVLYGKLGINIDSQNAGRYTKNNGQCLQALTLQALSKMHINANATVCFGSGIAYFNMADFLEDQLGRIFNYFNHSGQLKNKQQFTHFNYTLNALTKLDLEQKGLRQGNRLSNQDMVIGLIAEATPKIQSLIANNRIEALDLIRFLHNSFLIDLDILNEEFLDIAMSFISDNMSNRNLNDKVYSQLSIVVKIIEMKGINVPELLRTQMDQYTYNPETKGSKFEDEIYSQLLGAVNIVKCKYPNLIDAHGFDNTNPIVEGLDLEADILYTSLDSSIPDIGTVSFQVDGDRYHTYLGTHTINAKTKLRDVLFEAAGIPSVKFSDNSQGTDLAEKYLIKHIIEPGFKIRVNELLEKRNDLIPEKISQLEKSQSESYDEYTYQIETLRYDLSLVEQCIETNKDELIKNQRILESGINDGFYKTTAEYKTAKNCAEKLSQKLEKLNAQKVDLEANLDEALIQKEEYLTTMEWVGQQKPTLSFSFALNARAGAFTLSEFTPSRDYTPSFDFNKLLKTGAEKYTPFVPFKTEITTEAVESQAKISLVNQ